MWLRANERQYDTAKHGQGSAYRSCLGRNHSLDRWDSQIGWIVWNHHKAVTSANQGGNTGAGIYNFSPRGGIVGHFITDVKESAVSVLVHQPGGGYTLEHWVCKLRQWPVFFNIADIKDYGDRRKGWSGVNYAKGGLMDASRLLS